MKCVPLKTDIYYCEYYKLLEMFHHKLSITAYYSGQSFLSDHTSRKVYSKGENCLLFKVLSFYMLGFCNKVCRRDEKLCYAVQPIYFPTALCFKSNDPAHPLFLHGSSMLKSWFFRFYSYAYWAYVDYGGFYGEWDHGKCDPNPNPCLNHTLTLTLLHIRSCHICHTHIRRSHIRCSLRLPLIAHNIIKLHWHVAILSKIYKTFSMTMRCIDRGI